MLAGPTTNRPASWYPFGSNMDALRGKPRMQPLHNSHSSSNFHCLGRPPQLELVTQFPSSTSSSTSSNGSSGPCLSSNRNSSRRAGGRSTVKQQPRRCQLFQGHMQCSPNKILSPLKHTATTRNWNLRFCRPCRPTTRTEGSGPKGSAAGRGGTPSRSLPLLQLLLLPFSHRLPHLHALALV